MGEREQLLTRCDVVQQLLLRVAAKLGDQRTGRQCGVHDGLRCQPPPNLGEHHHDLDLARLVRVEAEAEDSGVGELTPDIAAPTEIGGNDFVASLGVIGA